MKKIISFMIVFSLLLTMQIPALASEPISVDDSDTYPLRKASSITPASEYYTINDHGDLVIFPTQEDYLLYVQSHIPLQEVDHMVNLGSPSMFFQVRNI